MGKIRLARNINREANFNAFSLETSAEITSLFDFLVLVGTRKIMVKA